MKIKFVLWGIVILSLFTLTLSAQSTTPAGNNVLNPAYLEADLNTDTVSTSEPLPINPNTTYSFAMNNGYGEVLEIWLDGNRIMEEDVLDPINCINFSNYIQCTFDSDVSESFEFKVSGNHIARSHLEYDDIFMLQEGSEINWYEAYEPVNDTEPVITAGGSIYLDYSQPIDLMDLVGSDITAYDDIDGDLTDEIIIVKNTYSDHKTQVGVYEVIYQVEDSASNIGQLQLDVHVLDQIPPEISGPSTVEVMVDDPPLIESIIDHDFSFWDDHDGIIENYTIMSDDYSGNKNTVGMFDVEFSVEDSSGNQTTKIFTIDVRDTIAPSIEGPKEVTMALSNPFTQLSDLLDEYTVSDNYTATEDMTLMIIDDDAPETLDRVGMYSVLLEVRDCSDNITQKNITLNIVDDVAPQLYGESLIQLSYTELFDVEAYIASMTVSDNHDNLTTDDIHIDETNYQYAEREVGRYYMVFKVSDAAGNTSKFSINIETYDDVAPYFTMSDPIIVAPTVTLSQADVFTHLMNDDAVNAFNPTAMVVITDEYTDNHDVPGTYEYEVQLTNGLGETMTHGTLITVNETNDSTSYPAILITTIGVMLLGTTVLISKRRQ